VTGRYRGSQVDDHAPLHRAPKPSPSHSPSPGKAFCPEITRISTRRLGGSREAFPPRLVDSGVGRPLRLMEAERCVAEERCGPARRSPDPD